MKILFVVLFTIFSLSLSGQTKGTVLYTDGSKLNFNDFVMFAFKNNSCEERFAFIGQIEVNYQNSNRSVPYSKLENISITNYKVAALGNDCGYIYDVTFTIKTKTGIETNTLIQGINLSGLYVDLIDDLTGDNMRVLVPLLKDNNLKVKSIIFN